ncbi:cyclic nucleotide-binding domain-containing protein [Chloroflexota bacterium]
MAVQTAQWVTPAKLQENPVLRNLDSEEIEKVMRLAERKSYKAGDYIFQQDEKAEAMFIVEQGRVDIIIDAKPDTNLIVTNIGGGGAFGWSALIGQDYTASAKCYYDTELIVLDGVRLREICFQEPRIGVKIMESLVSMVSSRLDNTRLQLLDIYAS